MRILLGLTFALLLVGCTNTASTSHAPDRAAVCATAERFVKEGLKSPATAKFQPCADRMITQAPAQPPTNDGSGAYWNVSGYVDSQNSFGALLRSTFRITMTYKGGNSWQRESMDIQ